MELNQVTSERPLRLRAVQPHVNTRELSTLSTFSFSFQAKIVSTRYPYLFIYVQITKWVYISHLHFIYRNRQTTTQFQTAALTSHFQLALYFFLFDLARKGPLEEGRTFSSRSKWQRPYRRKVKPWKKKQTNLLFIFCVCVSEDQHYIYTWALYRSVSSFCSFFFPRSVLSIGKMAFPWRLQSLYI